VRQTFEVEWIQTYQQQLAGVCDFYTGSRVKLGPLAVRENAQADAAASAKGSSASNQYVFYLNYPTPENTQDPQKSLVALPYNATLNAVLGGPIFYFHGPAITIDPSPPSKFDLLTVAPNADYSIAVFSLGYGTSEVHCWRQNAPPWQAP
jgi:hypothetical protein